MEVPFVWSLLPSDNASSGSSSSGSTSVPVPQHDEQPVSVVAPHWKGFLIPARWKIEKKMTGVIKIGNTYYGDVSAGYIRTQYPDEYDNAGNRIGSDEGNNVTTIDTYPNGFKLTLSYTFDPVTPNGYVQAKDKVKKLSFVGNSGVKFGTNVDGKAAEASILDVKNMVAMVGGLNSFWPASNGTKGIDNNGFVEVGVYAKEALSTLMNCVLYGGNYFGMNDYKTAGFTVPNLPSNIPPGKWEHYHQTLKKNHDRQVGTLILEVIKNPTDRNGNSIQNYYKILISDSLGYTYTLGLDSYNDPDDPLAKGLFLSSIGAIDLQSHWHSGVKFTNVVLIKY